MDLLSGVKVLELGGDTSAPFCARLLADYGAEVIKVESPGTGDPPVGKDPSPATTRTTKRASLSST